MASSVETFQFFGCSKKNRTALFFGQISKRNGLVNGRGSTATSANVLCNMGFSWKPITDPLSYCPKFLFLMPRCLP